ACLPTIEHATKRGARVILASHLGRPKGPTPGLSLEPVGVRLAELLGKEVLLTDEAVGDGARKVVADLRDGDVALLENLRFFPGAGGASAGVPPASARAKPTSTSTTPSAPPIGGTPRRWA